MPIYEYKCKKCNSAFSVFQRVGTGEEDTVCPECNSKDVKKQFSSFACSSSDRAFSAPSMPARSFGGS